MIQFVQESDKKLFEEAIAFAQKQVKSLIETHPGLYPMYTKGGKWKHDGICLDAVVRWLPARA